MRALISVYDKTEIIEFASKLTDLGWEIVSTGGTLASLEKSGVPVTPVSEVTGFPEILDGRVKTLHPAIHGGLLGRPGLASDREQLELHKIETFDMLVVNLYPFEKTLMQPGVTDEDAKEQIDIGGPAMIRAAAKNHSYVLVVVDPDDYESVLTRISEDTLDDPAYRRNLAASAFAHTSAYDSLVASYLASPEQTGESEVVTLAGRRAANLRYGENPHQSAAAYFALSPGEPPSGVLAADQISGLQLSYNNLLDADAAWAAVGGWDGPAAAIVKHSIPCGLAVSGELAGAFDAALAGDPVSAFGGIVAVNGEVDEETASHIATSFFEVVIAPGFAEGALAVLQKKRRLRLLAMNDQPSSSRKALDLRQIEGGLLIQDADVVPDDPGEWTCATDRKPTETESRDLAFAWRVVRLVKSNGIVLAKNRAVIGVGSGQPNRVGSVEIAVRTAGDRASGSVMASDAFFPFADGLEAGIRTGITAVIQPGGSKRDEEVIAAANEAGVAMIVTGVRHFRH